MADIQQNARWFDTTVNVQTLVTGIIGAGIALVTVYIALLGRVSTLEEHDKQQEAHFTRIETAMQEQRSDMRDQLRDISQSVKDTNAKIDLLKDQLMANSAGNRPGIKGWTK
ncbi:hypothetical protein AWB73_00135 [Caballeronia turbans]|nr:hypothetical protein AWB73_00135 [Caballeronia turbans]